MCKQTAYYVQEHNVRACVCVCLCVCVCVSSLPYNCHPAIFNSAISCLTSPNVIVLFVLRVVENIVIAILVQLSFGVPFIGQLKICYFSMFFSYSIPSLNAIAKRKASYADPEGGGGEGDLDPPEKSQNKGFSSNTGLDSLKNSQSYQASIQCRAIIGTPSKRHLNCVSLAGR